MQSNCPFRKATLLFLHKNLLWVLTRVASLWKFHPDIYFDAKNKKNTLNYDQNNLLIWNYLTDQILTLTALITPAADNIFIHLLIFFFFFFFFDKIRLSIWCRWFTQSYFLWEITKIYNVVCYGFALRFKG